MAFPPQGLTSRYRETFKTIEKQFSSQFTGKRKKKKKMLTLSVSPFKNSPKVFSFLLLSMPLKNVVPLIGFSASLSASWLSSLLAWQILLLIVKCSLAEVWYSRERDSKTDSGSKKTFFQKMDNDDAFTLGRR